MSSSVQGNFVDQAWGANLPGYFKDNVKPSVAGESFLIPRQNDSVPDIVTRNTVGTVYNRGFIDRPVNRLETTRSFILNPSSYNARLHPHDVTSGTGGIDNLSNLYRFGHPLPFSDAEDFADLQFFARFQKDKGLDPLTEGYAVKAIGEGGSMLSSAMAQDRSLLREKMNMQKLNNEAKMEEIKYRMRNGDDTPLTRANLQALMEQAARDARDFADEESAVGSVPMTMAASTPSSGQMSIQSSLPLAAAPAFTQSESPPAPMGAAVDEESKDEGTVGPDEDVPVTRITLTSARQRGFRIFLAFRRVGASSSPEYRIIAAPRQTERVDWMFISTRRYRTEDGATEGMNQNGTQLLDPMDTNGLRDMFGEQEGNFVQMPMNEEYAAEEGTYIKSEADTEDSSVAFVDEPPAVQNAALAPTSGAASVISSISSPSFRGPTRPPPPNTLDAIARRIFDQASNPSDPSSSSSSSSSASSLFSDLKSSIRSQLAAESENAGVSNSSYWDAQMRNTQDVKDLLHLMGARSSNPAAVFSNAYSATPYFVRRTQMGLDGNYSKRQAIAVPMRTQSKEPRIEQATSQSGDIFSTAEKASDPRVALLQGRRPGAATYLDPNLAAESGAFKQIEFHAGNNRYDGNIDGPSEQASLSIRNPTHARNMTGGVSRDFVKPTPENRQTAGVLGKNQRTPSANITIANRASTNPVSAFRGGSAPLRR